MASRAAPAGLSTSRWATAETVRPGRASGGSTSRRSRTPGRSSDLDRRCRMRSCTRIRHTASSTAPARRRSSSRRPPGSVCALALTDHDGLYGVVRFAEAAKELRLPTVFGAELSLGGGDRDRGSRSAGTAPAGARPRPGGLPPAVPTAGGRPAGRRREGQAALRLRRVDRGGRRALADPHRLPQRPCPPGAFRGRPGGGGRGAGRPGGPVRPRPGRRRAHRPRPPARRRAQRRPGRAGAAVRCRRRRHHRVPTTPSRPAAGWPSRWPRSGPGTRWTRRPAGCPAGRFTPAVGGGDGAAVRALPGGR